MNFEKSAAEGMGSGRDHLYHINHDLEHGGIQEAEQGWAKIVKLVWIVSLG